ncbi:hypothetical protein KC726_01310 [Candidatus Woesebacteria bacterium]|nr:hypothetical protein [Candidatus Woesebacteria bacterium]
MQKTIKLNYNKLQKQLAKMDKIAKENNWIFSYEEDTDSLYFSPKKIERRFKLHSLNDEMSIYIDNNTNLGGVFIEYYKANLATHEEVFKDFKNVFTKHEEGFLVIAKKNKKKEAILLKLLKENLMTTVSLEPSHNATHFIPA